MQNLDMFHTASSPNSQHQAIKPYSDMVPDVTCPLIYLNVFVYTQIQITLHPLCLLEHYQVFQNQEEILAYNASTTLMFASIGIWRHSFYLRNLKVTPQM